MLPPAKVEVAVLLLFFNRPEQLSLVFEQVRLARPSRLFLYQDGPRGERDLPGIEACRKVVGQVDWQCQVERLYQEQNYGCDPSEFLSQKWAFSHVDKCIVLEDDDVPHPSFFRFCKEMLDRYETDTRITMISGFNHEEHTRDIGDASYFFAATHTIWGWASWKRVIDQWDEHYTFLDDPTDLALMEGLIKQRGFRDDFLLTCRRHRELGKAFYESISEAAMRLSSGLAIVPRDNLINNLGVTTDSTHFAGSVFTLPHGYRRIFTMKRHEMQFPLTHPRHVIEHVAFKERVYRIMAWNHPWIKVGRSLEELWLNLRHGQFRTILHAVRKRILKWCNPKEAIH
ncbi:MAG: hemolysin activation protein [Bacteroidaceae bacterium]|nr:hemolysin activation protein [Bacteroidaceae bacterium]